MNQKHTVRQLLDKSRRGILRGIFSRTTIIVILLILQLLFIVSSFIWLDQYRFYVEIAENILRIGTVLYLINNRMDTTSKITWLLLILSLPLLGSLFLIYTKMDWGYRGMKRGILVSLHRGQPYLKQNLDVLAELQDAHSTTYNLVQYFRRTDGKYPVYKNTRVTYFPSGEAKFDEMKRQLLKAKKYIFLEYFIIDEGLMWGEILAILEQKVQEGVQVRVMYDGMIEMSTLSFDYKERLRAIGIEAKAFAPLSPFISTYYNYRDHRKLLVIDGQVAFNGGVNLADEYINEIERFGHWKDSAIMLEGEAVNSFVVMFLQMWSVFEDNPEFDRYLTEEHEHYEEEGFVIPYGDSPLDSDRVGENVYIDILNHARDYVYIMTPYLILDSELEHALRFASERGVDVRLIMPGIPDKKIPYYLAKTYYGSLLSSGVRIYEYTPGFVHSKVFLSDGIKGVVGTINLDYRSLYHHFECATYLYKTDCLEAINDDFIQTFRLSREITWLDWRQRPFYQKVIGVLIKMIAPLL
ncbi:cardiolipin synthase [Streptococcus fryi]